MKNYIQHNSIPSSAIFAMETHGNYPLSIINYILLIAFLLLLPFGRVWGQCTSYQAGTLNQNNALSVLPSYPSNDKYFLSQQIYTRSEIGTSGLIYSISFYNKSNITRTYDVFFKNTTKTSFSSTSDWVTVSDDDKVYSGPVEFTANNWVTINLDTPFYYDDSNSQNLVVIMYDKTGEWNFTGMSCCYFTGGSNTTLRGGNTSEINVASPVAGCCIGNQKNVIKFCIKPKIVDVSTHAAAVCAGMSTTLAVQQRGFTNPTYSWTASPSAGAGLPANTNSATISVTPSAAGNYEYTCSVTEGTTTETASMRVMVGRAPTVTFTGSYTFCGTQDISPTITQANCGDLVYSWGGAGSGSGESCSASSSGTYRVTVTDKNLKRYDMIQQNGIRAIVVEAPTLTGAGKAVPIYDGKIGTNTADGTVAYNGYTYLQEAIKANGGNTYTGSRNAFKITAGAGVCQSSGASVSVTINAAPTLTYSSGPTTQTVCTDNAITDIKYNYSGSSTPTVTGLPDGVTPSTSAGVLTLSGSPTASGTFNYTVSMSATSPCTAPESLHGTITVNAAPTEPTSISGTKTICSGSSTTLTASGGTVGTNSNIYWYKGNSCPTVDIAFAEPFDATGYGTHNCTYSCSNSVAHITTSASDPWLTMNNLGQFAYPTYKYIHVRYKASNVSGNMQIFFFDRDNPGAAEARSKSLALSNDGKWHILTFDLSTCSTRPVGYVTGWRFDYANNSNAVMDVDYIVVSSSATPPESVGATFATQELTAGTTYQAFRYGTCGRSSSCKGVTVNVQTPSVGTATASADPATICNGGSSTLSVGTTGNSGTMSYAWNTGGTGTSISVSPTVNTTYTVTATATTGAGCTAKTTKQVTVAVQTPAVGTVTASADPATICNGGSSTLSVGTTGNSGTMSYAWNTGGTGTSISVSPTVNTTYTVTATATTGAGCTAKTTKQVTVAVQTPAVGTVTASADPATICNGGSSTLSVGTTGNSGTMSYAWNIGGTGTSISVSPTVNTTYTVTATATVGGCIATTTKQVTVAVNSPVVGTVTASADPATICNGGSSELTASATGNSGTMSYAWSNGESGATVSVSPTVTTTYTVTATATVGGCIATTTKQVTVAVNSPAVGTVTASADPATICNGGSSELTAGATGNTGTMSYAWSNGESGATVNVSPTVTTTYTVTATATVGGCIATTTKQVTVAVQTPAVGTVTASADPATICNGGSSTLSVGTTGNSGTMSYAWNIGGTGTSISVSPTVTTTYTVTATATTGAGCTAKTTKQVTVTVETPSVASIVASASSSTLCVGKPATLSVSATGTGTMSYEWSAGTTGESTTVTPSVTTTYTVTATATTGAGCTATAKTTVRVEVSSPSVSGIAAGDFVWSGNEGTTDWSTPGNWLKYSTSTPKYSVAVGEVPTTASNVFIVTYGSGCSVGNPVLSAKSNAFNLKIGSGKTLSLGSDSDTLIVKGNFTNEGTFYGGNGRLTLSKALNNTGIINAETGTLSVSGNLTNSGTLNAGGKTLTVSGNFTNTGTFNPGAGTLSLKKNLTNTGTFKYNKGTVSFTGKVDQVITNSGSMNFCNVKFNQTALKTIKADNGITVNKKATFTKGIVMSDMTFVASAISAGASDTSFVAGTVTKQTGASAETNFTFPTGSAGDGQPKVLGSIKVASLPANSETYAVFSQKSNGGGFSESEMPRWWNQNNNCEGNDPLFDHISNFEFWNVSTNSALTADITVSANNRNAHFSPDAVSYDGEDIFGAMWQGGCWKKVSDHAVVSDPKTITISGVTIPAVSTRASEPQWLSLGSKNHETLLPIELLSFTATCDGRSALVEWTTATEKNNDYFSLERSDDAVNFTEIARIAGAGNSIEPLNYAYTDYGIHGGDNYYRLVQVDYDGTRTVSEIVVANCIEPEVGEPDVQAYPNPFNGELTLELDNFGNRPATIEVYDMLGKLIYTEKVAAPQNFYETILNLSNLPPAAYNVRVSTIDFVINKQVVKN